MTSFTVTITIIQQQVSDLLCTALDAMYGSSRYWAEVEDIIEPKKWEFSSDPENHYMHDYPLNPGGEILLFDREEDEKKILHLNAEAIQKGLSILSLKYPHIWVDILHENIDANTGDAFLQCCLLGDIVYDG